MGKGKLNRALSNASRRRRKRRVRKFINHITKHPNYWNERNPIPFHVWQLIVIIYALMIAMSIDSDLD